MRRKRNVKLEFWVTPDEKEQIEQKMAELGTENLSAYLRKMAIDGRILKLDLPELRELLSVSYTHLDVYKRQSCSGVSSP